MTLFPHRSEGLPRAPFGLSTAELVVAVVLIAASAYLLVGGLASSFDTGGDPVNDVGLATGRDFTMFYSASTLVRQGDASSVYDFEVIRDAQGSLTGVASPSYPGWLYPPTALLLVEPVSTLPYRAAFILWSLAGLVALAMVLWNVVRRSAAVAVLLLFPAVSLCVLNGQSGLFLAALIGGALVLLDDRPWAAGFLLGVASVKPQLLILLVPCLLLGRHWKVVAGMAVTALILAALSVAVFGAATWTAFFESVVRGVDILQHVRPLERMPSVFVAASLAGLGRGAAMTLQGLVGVLLLVAVGRPWARRSPIAVRGAALLFAAPLVTPYSFDYDLAVLTVALAWMAIEVKRRGWLGGERILLVLLWIAPIAGWLLAVRTGVLLTPLVLLACAWSVLRAPRLEEAMA